MSDEMLNNFCLKLLCTVRCSSWSVSCLSGVVGYYAKYDPVVVLECGVPDFVECLRESERLM